MSKIDSEKSYWQTLLGAVGSINTLRFNGYGYLGGVGNTVTQRERSVLGTYLGISAAALPTYSTARLRRLQRLANQALSEPQGSNADLERTFWSGTPFTPPDFVKYLGVFTDATSGTSHTFSGITPQTPADAGRSFIFIFAYPEIGVALVPASSSVNGVTVGTAGGSVGQYTAASKGVHVINTIDSVSNTLSVTLVTAAAVTNCMLMVYEINVDTSKALGGGLDINVSGSSHGSPFNSSMATFQADNCTVLITYDTVAGAGNTNFGATMDAEEKHVADFGGNRLAVVAKYPDNRNPAADTVTEDGVPTGTGWLIGRSYYH